MVADTFILQNCDVTSPTIGTIRVSCDSSHQIQITAICTDDCNKVIVTDSGYSPLTVRGLDPGKRYTVAIDVFDGNRVVLSDETVSQTITVMNTISSKINDCMQTVVSSYSLNACSSTKRSIHVIFHINQVQYRFKMS